MKVLLLILLIFPFYQLSAQTGCTDPSSSNYNVTASQNDGSCTYSASHASFNVKGVFASDISESSGLEYFNGDILTHNDSGNSAALFIVDSSNGKIKQTIYIDNHPNTDWEDISADRDYVYVGDFGNNDGNRTDLSILKIKRSDISIASVIHVNAEVISFSYADQTSFTANSSTNFDCESMLSFGDFLYLFSKDKGDNQSRVYKVSKTPGTYVLSAYTSFNVEGQITGADYNPVTRAAVLIGYELKTYTSFIWLLNDFKEDLFFSGNKRKVVIGDPLCQTEGITYDTLHNKLFVSCETAGFTKASLFTLNTPISSVTTPIQQTLNTSILNIYPNPSNESIQVIHAELFTHIEVIDVLGRIIFQDEVSAFDYRLSLNRFPYTDGIHCMRISGAGYSIQKEVVLIHE